MRSPTYLAIALAVLSLGLFAAPKASACGSCGVINQGAVLDTTLSAPVFNTTLMQRSMLGTTLMQPSVIDSTLMQPSVIDSTLVQPSIIQLQPSVVTQPVIIQQQPVLRFPAYDDFYRIGRRHLYGYHLF